MGHEGKIEGTNVLITGGASGLGAAHAEAFLKYGAANVAILDIAEQTGIKFTKKLNEIYKNKAIFIKCDVSKEEEIENGFQKVLAAFKKIDVLINNAGIMNDSPNVWRTTCDVNWQGVISFTMKGIGHMRKNDGGSGGTIINISSGLGIVRRDVLPIYCGSKAAILHFGRSISSPEFYETTGVRVLTMCFWATATPMLHDMEPKFINQKFTKTLLATFPLYEQSIDSAATALVKMFREGSPGSVWLSTYDQPGQDITSALDAAFEPLEKLVLPDSVDGV